MLLSYARKGYSEAVLRQDTKTFLRCLENGLRAFVPIIVGLIWRGVPLLLNLDNLKAAVLKTDWFDPEINPKLARLLPALAKNSGRLCGCLPKDCPGHFKRTF
jgi:hypothetical protein